MVVRMHNTKKRLYGIPIPTVRRTIETKRFSAYFTFYIFSNHVISL